MLIENTIITHTLSNNEDIVFPNITASLFTGERYIYSKVPAILSKEKFQADCTSDLNRLRHIYPRSINTNKFFSLRYDTVLLPILKGLKLKYVEMKHNTGQIKRDTYITLL
jgi:hypothetical protein